MQATPAHWEILSSQLHADCKVFSVRKQLCRHPRRAINAEFYVINAFPWAVTLALTPENELVLVQQYRFGVDALSWELPAGCIDPGEDPVAAGVRELQEESGYQGHNARLLGESWPNPALQNNTCYFVLIENAQPSAQQEWDAHEEIAVCVKPVDEVFAWARTGKIRHAMVLNALFYFEPWYRKHRC